MISISNCPISGLERKVEYDFYWYTNARQIIVRCTVHYYKDGQPVTGLSRIKSYVRDLVASDSKVNPQDGTILTDQEVTAYENALSAYNSYVLAQATYEADILEYNAAYSTYVTNLAAFNAAYDEYNTLLAAYNEAMSMSPQNPDNLEEPIQPALQLPVAPTAPTDPTLSPEPTHPGPAPIAEYDFYAFVLGVQPLILPNLIQQIILLRDSQGKFDI